MTCELSRIPVVRHRKYMGLLEDEDRRLGQQLKQMDSRGDEATRAVTSAITAVDLPSRSLLLALDVRVIPRASDLWSCLPHHQGGLGAKSRRSIGQMDPMDARHPDEVHRIRLL